MTTELNPKSSSLRDLAVRYLWSLLGTPYAWGGDDPMRGFDCSGLIHEVLQAVGLEPHGTDSTAHDLYLHYKLNKVEPEATKMGCLIFWFRNGRAIHVEMAINQNYCIGASGGGSQTTTIAEAIKQNAFVKLRPIHYRGTQYKVIDPFKNIEEE